mmetsp:Transcript_34501/g.62552  ORF Transcript_34501/g.62552 Transcript_34501/m.62552 type:complete len:1296 (+) Transcript_34501:108-3995(+)|eukprot:CAMPEP_0197621778 /NCGR_PEP_ID=MMETSP1338-20131121/2243_1 /TAXON_ID=43686 ORGANISM="Pelagodinium beii, Strain RCC1491" /NCGR_SAMPLE_ID=MMETSP1338 /ASSEMBLY_ACC=CAM_ASM_000754 /LENGTH=1295 /DNA_ID=CAMNT_0043191319 /DNA_START=78 /DNA_END=3965 /DNA_ORIENTATION=-
MQLLTYASAIVLSTVAATREYVVPTAYTPAGKVISLTREGYFVASSCPAKIPVPISLTDASSVMSSCGWQEFKDRGGSTNQNAVDGGVAAFGNAVRALATPDTALWLAALNFGNWNSPTTWSDAKCQEEYDFLKLSIQAVAGSGSDSSYATYNYAVSVGDEIILEISSKSETVSKLKLAVGDVAAANTPKSLLVSKASAQVGPWTDVDQAEMSQVMFPQVITFPEFGARFLKLKVLSTHEAGCTSQTVTPNCKVIFRQVGVNIVDKESCDRLTCPSTYADRPNKASLFCEGSCSPADNTDVANCCEKTAQCTTFPCPRSYTDKPGKSSLWCAELFCTDRDLDTCCVPQKSCASMACDAFNGYVQAENAATLYCAGATCTAEDKSRCCTHKETCSLLTCPANMVRKANAATIFCAGRECSASVDTPTCCEAKAPCSSVSCGSGFKLKADGHCAGTTCTVSDKDTCCVETASCSTMSCDFEGFQDHYQKAQRHCTSNLCTEADKSICCEAKAKCSTLTCDGGWADKPEKASLYCAGTTCDIEHDGDKKICCSQLGRCVDLPCEGDGVVGFKEKEASVKASLYCSSSMCTSADRSQCCDALASCSHLVCEKGYVDRRNKAMLFCGGTSCAESDMKKCCHKQQLCESLSCPQGQTSIQLAHNTPCNSYDCSLVSDVAKCCTAIATCASFTCPADYTAKLNKTLPCTGNACDHNTCCEKRAKCSTLPCNTFKGFTPRQDSLFCLGTTCTEAADKLGCCIEHGGCLAMTCPTGYHLKSNAKDLYCKSGELASSIKAPCQSSSTADVAQCCEPSASCSTLPCPVETHVDKILKNQYYCDGANCEKPRDVELCCDARTSCANLTCGLGLADKKDKESRLCSGTVCSAYADGPLCCDRAAPCADLTCTSKKHHLVSRKLPNLYCAGTECKFSVDNSTCCVQAASCATLDCMAIPGKMQLPDMSKAFCAGALCLAEVDNQTCCQSKAACNDLPGVCTSYAGFANRTDASTVIRYCSDTECADDDKEWCCAKRAACSSYSCPKGYVEKENAAVQAGQEKLLCAGAECGEEDTSTCCDAAASCDQVACTGQYVDQIDKAASFCHGTSCNNDTDIALCCDLAANCSALSCSSLNSSSVNRVEHLLCRSPGSRCTTEDFETCCEPIPTLGGACRGSLLPCPAGITDPCVLEPANGTCYSGFHNCDGSGEFKQCILVGNASCTAVSTCSIACSDATIQDPDFSVRSCPALGFQVATAVVNDFLVVTASVNGETVTTVATLHPPPTVAALQQVEAHIVDAESAPTPHQPSE